MMRLLALFSLAAVAIAPNLAAAQVVVPSNSGRLELSGEAPTACNVAAPSLSSSTNASLSNMTAQSARIDLSQFVDPTTAEPLASSASLDFNIVCNGAHQVRVQSVNGALALEGPGVAAGGFRNRVPYQVAVNWAGQNAAGGSEAGTPVDLAIANAATGDMRLDINVAAGGGPLVAGSYADQVVVEVSAAN